ncbi:MAG: two-component regulator propeller domain-containing protein [Verrucomicrobiales bacterium]|nr:two-component regulator propeller domain-containing protein [Verrucomicrobiales bacterium]
MWNHLKRLCGVAALGCGVLPGTAPGAETPGGELTAPLFAIRSWSTREGLPQSAVTAITQTRDGYLWLGTLNGLVRFDGMRFSVFDEGNTPELGSGRIVLLFEDSRSNLWVGTETAGLRLLEQGRIVEVRDPGQPADTPVPRVMALCEDPRGAVWYYTADGQLCRYRDGSVEVWRHDPQRGGMPSSYRTVFTDGGRLWAGVNWGLFSLNLGADFPSRALPWEQFLAAGWLDAALAARPAGSRDFAEFGYWRLADGRIQLWRTNRLALDLGAYPWSNDTQVSAACVDNAGHLVIGTQNPAGGEGVYWFDAKGGVTRITSEQGLSHNGILSLWVDREENLWVGTAGGGLNRVRRSPFAIARPYRGWVVQTVCPDAQGGLWIGFNGGGLVYWREGAARHFGHEEGLGDLFIRSVFVDREARVWVGTWRGGLYQLVGERFQQPPGFEIVNLEVAAIHQDRAGRLWFGTQGGLVRWEGGREWRVLTTREGLSADAVRALADDAEGNLWIGTERGGLNRLRDGRITVFRKRDGALPSDNISALLVDSEGVLWVGTGAGLARLHGGRWSRFTTAEGLVGNGISYLAEDDAGQLWIGSNAGLMRVPKTNFAAVAQGRLSSLAGRAFSEVDGLPTRECSQGSQPAVARTRDGRLWFPTTQGLVSVRPEALRPNPVAPPVVIESVRVAGRAQETNALRGVAPGRLEVAPQFRRAPIEVHYTALNLAAPQGARFRYQLEGFDPDWIEAGERRVAIYSKLPPGEYRFRVTAANEDGVWQPQAAGLILKVRPAFWQTAWFRIAAVAALLGALAGGVHFVSTRKLQRQVEQLRQREAIERERARIARDLHDQLGANLTQIALLGELAEADRAQPDEVAEHARQIAATARETTRALDEIVWAANPANDTLESLVTYACKYAQDYLALAGLRYRLEVPEPLPEVSLPPDTRHHVFLAFKEAVNNVVKHARATSARVRLRLEPHRFHLEIEDDGRGLPPDVATSASGRNGLRNMRRRMEDVGGEFYIGPGGNGGTLVRLSVPWAGTRAAGH